MNRYALSILAVIIASLFLAVLIGLKYSQASLLFGLVALVLAPIATRKIENATWALTTLFGLSYFAAKPVQKLFQIEGILYESTVVAAYFCVLFVVSLGWRRSWT